MYYAEKMKQRLLEKTLENNQESGGVKHWNDIEGVPFGEKTVMGDTLTWDGNTEGLEVGYERFDGGDTLLLYRISEATPSYDEMVVNGYSLYDSIGSGRGSNESDASIEGVDDNFFAFGNWAGVVVCEDNHTFSDDDEGVEMYFPKKGIYAFKISGEPYMVSLTINGYTGFPKEQVKQEYLPNLVIKIKTACISISDSEWEDTFLNTDTLPNYQTWVEWIRNAEIPQITVLCFAYQKGSPIDESLYQAYSIRHYLSDDYISVPYIEFTTYGPQFYLTENNEWLFYDDLLAKYPK